jgi:hypothetical protein
MNKSAPGRNTDRWESTEGHKRRITKTDVNTEVENTRVKREESVAN